MTILMGGLIGGVPPNPKWGYTCEGLDYKKKNVILDKEVCICPYPPFRQSGQTHPQLHI